MMHFEEVSIDKIFPNAWNPNVMSQEDYERALESIERFGFVDPITVREVGAAHYEIIDGENRWRAAQDKGMTIVPVVVLEVDDDDAKALTIVLNELRGKPDPTRLRELVAELAARRPMADLEAILPFRRSELAAMVAARREEIDWGRLQAPVERPETGRKERWLERVFRLPVSAAGVVDEAIARARASEDGLETWQALELIAADFISGH